MVTARTFPVNYAKAIAAAGMAAAWSAPAMAGGALAGTVIETTAEASYELGGASFNVTSNTVQLQVDELIDVALAALDATPVKALSAGEGVLTFALTNTGNGPEAYVFAADPAVSGNAFDAVVTGIATDSNGNGVFDPGVDPVLPLPATTEPIPPQASRTTFVLFRLPADLAAGARSKITLTARAVTGSGAPGTSFAGAGEDGSNAVLGASGGQAVATGEIVAGASRVTLAKSATITDPFGGTAAVPNATITFAITAQVSGSEPVDDLVISDVIPAGTRYLDGSLSLNGATITDAAGDGPGEASAAGITVSLGTIAAGATNTVAFAVVIEEVEPTP